MDNRYQPNHSPTWPSAARQTSLTAQDDLTRRWETVSPPELANLLGVGHRKVLDWIRNGELVARNMAGAGSRFPRYAIPISEVDQFLARRRTNVAAMAGMGGRG